MLNIGEAAIPGAVARIAALRRAGKRLCVLSNAASYTPAGVLAKYRRLGFDFDASEVVTSRAVAARRLDAIRPGGLWAVIAEAGDDCADLGVRTVDAATDPGALDHADGVLFLAIARYGPALHARLAEALSRRALPLVVANPDLVSPREDGLVREPGWFAHDLIDRVGAGIHWFGKPYEHAFADAVARIGCPPERLAMVGDTLHTDVLGARAAGLGTVLVSGHGMFAGSGATEMARGAVAASRIVPDVIVPTI